MRKEREARDRQDAMTLGETREQIQLLNTKLEELKNEKQQLFLRLKKVLNEDENRKKQQQQKDSEMFALQNMQQGPHQIFLPPRAPHQQLMQKVRLMLVFTAVHSDYNSFVLHWNSIYKVGRRIWQISQLNGVAVRPHRVKATGREHQVNFCFKHSTARTLLNLIFRT